MDENASLASRRPVTGPGLLVIPTHLTTCNDAFWCIKKPRRQNRNRLLLNGDRRGENASLQRKTGSLRKQLTEAFSWCKGPVLTGLTQETDIKGRQINLRRLEGRKVHQLSIIKIIPWQNMPWNCSDLEKQAFKRS